MRPEGRVASSPTRCHLSGTESGAIPPPGCRMTPRLPADAARPDHATVRAALAAIEGAEVHPYGTDAWLVDLPLTYPDGHIVRLFVAPRGRGYRVSDRGGNVGQGSSGNALFGTADEIVQVVHLVAQASVRFDQHYDRGGTP